ncbi:unnamed protein product [Miscanthus lutarioriparius]|uniref:Uncharacterized protein n=1 Tax=Miscanthus lutarioriparius TaxID=422564 RepID=A0A811QLC5_9POAL|nr:unnamed protein product [Miscanthus lutarioriparius]
MDDTIVKQVDYGIQSEDYSSHKTVLILHYAPAGTQDIQKAIFKDESTVGIDTQMPDAEHNQLPKQL